MTFQYSGLQWYLKVLTLVLINEAQISETIFDIEGISLKNLFELH